MDEQQFEQRLEQIVKNADFKISQLTEKIDDKVLKDKLNNLGKEIDSKIEERLSSKCKPRHHRRNSEFWGFVLVAVGFLFLAENMRWIDWDLPFWPTVLIIIGAYLIFQNLNND